MATCTIQTTLTIATEGALNLTQISSLLDDLLAVGFADAADSAEDSERAAAACELEVTLTNLVEIGATPGPLLTYTVILLLPDDVAHTFGQDTYCRHIIAPSPAQAIEAAQRECAAQDDHDDPDAYFVIACFEGSLRDLNPEQ